MIHNAFPCAFIFFTIVSLTDDVISLLHSCGAIVHDASEFSCDQSNSRRVILFLPTATDKANAQIQGKYFFTMTPGFVTDL